MSGIGRFFDGVLQLADGFAEVEIAKANNSQPVEQTVLLPSPDRIPESQGFNVSPMVVGVGALALLGVVLIVIGNK